MKTGVDLIAAERKRQIEKEGWTLQHDRDEHTGGELALAACCYAAPQPERRNVRDVLAGLRKERWG